MNFSDAQIDAAAAAAAERANGGKFKDPLFYAPEHRAFWREVMKAGLEAAGALRVGSFIDPNTTAVEFGEWKGEPGG